MKKEIANKADKMGAADRRAQKCHVEDRHLSIEAAESYLEAGRLSQALKRECSRGKLKKARRRAGLTAKRAKKLMRLATDWHEPAHLYERFNRTDAFRTEAEALHFRDDMARKGVDVLIETADAWAARTRGEVGESATQPLAPAIAEATWFATFYAGEDEKLLKAWFESNRKIGYERTLFEDTFPRREEGLLDVESTAALVEALRRVDNEAAERVGADTIETHITQRRGLTSVARNLNYLHHRNAAYRDGYASYVIRLVEEKPDAGRAMTDGGAARVEPAHVAAARGIGDEMGKIGLAVFFGRPRDKHSLAISGAPPLAGPTVAERAARAIADAMRAIADEAPSPAESMARTAHAIGDAMKEIADDAQSPSDTAARAARAIADEIRKMADDAQSPSGAAARVTAAAARAMNDVANMLYVGADEARAPTAARAVRAIADEMSKIADEARAP